MCVPKNMLQGSVRVLIRNLHASALAGEIIYFVEVEGAKALDLHVTQNKVTGEFTGSLKSTLSGKNAMSKWVDAGKSNLGGVRRPIERERKAHQFNNFFHIWASRSRL